jgi:hypothetical protein
MMAEPMTDERREFLRVFYEVQDHTHVHDIEAELWREIARLLTIVNKIPKCWRLVDGKLVQDCSMTPGMIVWPVEPGEDEQGGTVKWGVEDNKDKELVLLRMVAFYATREAAEEARNT